VLAPDATEGVHSREEIAKATRHHRITCTYSENFVAFPLYKYLLKEVKRLTLLTATPAKILVYDLESQQPAELVDLISVIAQQHYPMPPGSPVASYGLDV